MQASAEFEISIETRPRITPFLRPKAYRRLLKNGEKMRPANSSIPSTRPTYVSVMKKEFL